jgi:hypothetical protein
VSSLQFHLHLVTTQDYKAVFEPLLLEECCAQIMRGVEEGEVLTPHPTVVATSEQVGAAHACVHGCGLRVAVDHSRLWAALLMWFAV